MPSNYISHSVHLGQCVFAANFVCSSYHLNLSFLHLVVILTTLETPKNIFCFNNNIMNDNLLTRLSHRTTQPSYMGITMNVQIVLKTKKNPYLSQAAPTNTCPIFLPKKIVESKLLNLKKSFDPPNT